MESLCAWFGARGTSSATDCFGAGGARDPPNPKMVGRLGCPGGLPKVQPSTPDVLKVSLHGLGAVGPLLRLPVWSAHTKRAPAATCGALYCSEMTGAREDTGDPDLRIRRCRASSRGLQSLGAFEHMVLFQRARKNGSNKGTFRDLSGTNPK